MDNEVRLIYCDVCQDTVEVCEETGSLTSIGCHSFNCPFEGFSRDDDDPKPLDFNKEEKDSSWDEYNQDYLGEEI